MIGSISIQLELALVLVEGRSKTARSECSASLMMREQLSLRRRGKNVFSGNICGQHFASTAEAALQHIGPTLSNFPTILRTNKPDLVFYDSADWIPEIAKPVGAKTVCYNTFSAASIVLTLVPAAEREIIDGKEMSAEELAKPPLG
ncbi:BnaC04g37360D [Brassica napus]|uniref:BnaC04g37360D protein n=2 Tax=Brassica napus TaxID=3708 RepID=A0A078HH18_BRANA|nr:BnaC04g37360D [Brassica napus]